MSAVCANSSYAAQLAVSQSIAYAVVVCSSTNATFPSDHANGAQFYGCTTGESCPDAGGRIWANCSSSGAISGQYHFAWAPEVFDGSACSVPVVTLDTNGTFVLDNVTATSTAHPKVSLFKGKFTGNAIMLWAYDDADVTSATPTGYFASEVTTSPQACGYLACNPTGNTSAVPCDSLSPSPEPCTGNATLCSATPGGYSLCIDAECDWVFNSSAYASHPVGSYFYPPGCRPFTVCEHTTVPSIFPDDNTCLCLPGFEPGALGSCHIQTFSTGIVCAETQYASVSDGTYKCINLTTCDGTPLLEATPTSDRVCVSPPKVCEGFVDSSTGVCITPQKTCTSIQLTIGSSIDGAPECINLSPPCPAHSFEKVAPTPTSDRVCERYTGVNVYAATGFAVAPCLGYFAFMAYRYTR